jgi:Restriction endonuclease
MSYYNTYYFANVINNVINDRFDYLRNLDEFLVGYLTLSDKFEKRSILHQFISFIIEDLFYESIEEDFKSLEQVTIEAIKKKKVWLNLALNYHGIKHTPFKQWINENSNSNEHPEDLFYTYINEFLYDERLLLIEKLTDEVFYILFMNRKFLLNFNYFISGHIARSDINDMFCEYRDLLSKSGVLKRTNIPEWVKNAVYFRDRGHCVFCESDLPNIITRLSIKNYDHIVPLNQGGVNDVSNIQLTCKACNMKKLDKEVKTSNVYELWY